MSKKCETGAPRKVLAAGFTVLPGTYAGGYNLHCWVRYETPAFGDSELYKRLMYTELIDVMLAHLDAHRPGQVEGEGWVQPTLD